MQGTLATLLLITSAVILTGIVVDYAVVTVQQTLQTTNIPQLDQLRNLQNSLLNQTGSLFNQTQALPMETSQP